MGFMETKRITNKRIYNHLKFYCHSTMVEQHETFQIFETKVDAMHAELRREI